jgi:two-component system sensor histidine kinase BaeS
VRRATCSPSTAWGTGLPNDDRRREWGGREWGGRDWGTGAWQPPRGRPPWWPEGEAWPPERPEAWRALRRRFARRAAGFAVIVLVSLLVITAALSWLLTTLFGGGWVAAVLLAAVILAFAVMARRLVGSVRGAAAPMSELIEASARVEAGQFGAQVHERGPREVRTLTRAFNAMSARLAESDAERRRLLADVSHELRTPLTVIQGNVEGILDGLYPADRAILERIVAETRHLERLIDDLRTLSTADAGALALQREPTDLGAVAAELVLGFEPQAASAGISLLVDAAEGLRDLELDPLRVRQVVTNLMSNALRHTPAGGRVTVAVSDEGGDQVLRVVDTGTGMDADAAAHAFDRFWRSADSPGAGLGLAIARDLVVAHGGEMSLESSVGAGTTVTCRFRG